MSMVPLIRRVSVHVTPVLARLPVSANQVTAVSLLAGLASGWCMMQGDRTWGLIGGVLLVICYVLDNCDGEIARLKNQTSRLGMHFDTFVDAAVHTFCFVALGDRGQGNNRGRRVAEQRAGGSTGREAADQPRTPRGRREWIVFPFRELARADFCFIVLALAVFDLTWALLPAVAAGAHVYWVTRFVRGAGQYHV